MLEELDESSASVAVTLEVEVELEDSAVKRALEAMPLRHLPLLVHYGEGDVLIRDASTKSDCKRVGCAILLQVELRSARLVSKLRIEDVELVALDDLGWWILRVIMRLVVLVPLVALLYAVEEARLPHDEELLLRFEHH